MRQLVCVAEHPPSCNRPLEGLVFSPFRRLVVVGVLLTGVVACTTTGTEQVQQAQALNLGVSRDEVVKRLGEPTLRVGDGDGCSSDAVEKLIYTESRIRLWGLVSEQPLFSVVLCIDAAGKLAETRTVYF